LSGADPGLELRRVGPDALPPSGGVSFWIHVTPRAAHARVGGLHGGALRISVCEPPVEGEANAACVRALARALDVARAAVHLDPGAKGRRKRVQVAGDPAALEARLRALAGMAGGQRVG
jgi:uncharacterized protein YggU (UPF0235/DUF167 family)